MVPFRKQHAGIPMPTRCRAVSLRGHAMIFDRRSSQMVLTPSTTTAYQKLNLHDAPSIYTGARNDKKDELMRVGLEPTPIIGKLPV